MPSRETFKDSHVLVATWIPTEHFSVLQHAAKTHNVTFAAYLRAILVDALAEEGLLVQ